MLICMAKTDPRARLVSDMLATHGLSVRWLAQQIGASHVAMGTWLNGDKSPRNKDVWDLMVQSIRDHVAGSLIIAESKTIYRRGMRKIPLSGSISAGKMASAEADLEEIEIVDTGTDAQQWARPIRGFSMSSGDEMGLEPNDIVVFEDRPYEPYHVVHAFDKGEDVVKVIRGQGANTELVPINPDYEILPGKDAHVKGVAVQRIRSGPDGIQNITIYPHGMRYRIPKV